MSSLLYLVEKKLQKNLPFGICCYPDGSAKESASNEGDKGDTGSIPDSGRSPGGGHDYPLEYSCWKVPWTESLAGYNPQVTVGGTWLSTWHIYWLRYEEEVKSLSRVGLCDPVDCSLPGCSIHGILQARILEWVAISFSRGSSQPRDRTQVSHIAGRCFAPWATREANVCVCVCVYTHSYIYAFIGKV